MIPACAGTGLVGLGLGGDLRQHQALLAAPGADHVQRRLAAGMVEGTPQHLAVDGDNALDDFIEPCHEPLEGGTELLRVQHPEQPAEGVVAGRAVLQGEEAAQERLLGDGEQRHVDRALPAAQHGAEGDHQDLVEVVLAGIPAARVIQAFQASDELVHGNPPRCAMRVSVESSRVEPGKTTTRVSRKFQVRFPWLL